MPNSPEGTAPPPGRRPVRGVLFDLGNTLARLDCAWLAQVASALGRAPVDAAAAALAEAHERLDEERPPAGEAPGRAGFPDYLSGVGRRLGLDAGACAALARRALREHGRRPYGLWDVADADAGPVLAALAGAGIRLGVVSNNDGRAAALVRALSLDRWLDVVVDSAVVGVRKPDPRIFAPALDALAVTASGCLYVGDSYAHDVQGARAAGLSPVLYDPLGLWTACDAPVVRRLTEVAALATAGKAP